MSGRKGPQRSTAASDSDAAPKAAPRYTIQELLPYRLSRVANAMTRSAAVRYRRDFDVSIGEWRTIALLGSDAPLTLNRLARLAALDKAQMSRVVTKLVERGLVLREYGPGRTSVLTLTRRGKSLYAALITVANERNDAFLVCLSPHEYDVLETALEKLEKLARLLEQTER